jgi:hypothetical protein
MKRFDLISNNNNKNFDLYYSTTTTTSTTTPTINYKTSTYVHNNKASIVHSIHRMDKTVKWFESISNKNNNKDSDSYYYSTITTTTNNNNINI